MPLAMTLKALIARLHTIWVCLKDELQVFLTLLKSSPKKKVSPPLSHSFALRDRPLSSRIMQSNLAMDLDAYATHLPRELSRFWKTGSTKGTKGGKDASASVSASASSSAMPSRTQSPMTSRPVEGGKMSNASKLQSQINSIADSDMNDMTASPATAVDSPSSTVLEPVAVPIPTKKAKKRKRPVAGDDIDAIFAGL